MNPARAVMVAAEMALLALSVVVTIALERLFVDTSFLSEVLIMVVGSHLVAIACRRGALSMPWSTLVSASTLVLLGSAVFYPEAATVVVPSTETIALLGDDLQEAWTTFSEDSAPVPPLRGFLVTASVLLWYGIFLADWAAFRLRSPLEAVVPATAVFVFAALLGVDRHQVAHGVTYAAGVLGVLLTMRAERQTREEVWVASGTAAGVTSTLRVGLVTGLAVVVAGGVIAPSLPGADGPPLIDVTELDQGPSTRRVISPLVEISASLVEQSDEEIFSVKVAPADRDYWRLMALTSFDGDIWRRSSNFEDIRGPVDSDVDATIPRRIVRQEISTRALNNIYLPAAYEVTEVVDDGGVDLEYEVATGALVVTRDSQRQAELGFTYVIDSAVPDYDPATLPARAAAGLDDGFVAEHTQLPPPCGAGQSAAIDGCWPTAVNALAQDITQGATTDYERVRQLQAHFTDPANYTYDLEVALRHDVSDVEDFLFVTRRGYCEQFSSVFAAMARSLGIPARVAVGFTWGEWDESRGEYVVRGHHAHAWPEVFFAGVGWVVLDPTPGRSRPHDTDITGLPEQQFPANELGEVPPTTATVPTGGSGPGATVPAPRPSAPQPTPEPTTPVAPDDTGVPTAIWVLLAVVVGAGILVGIVPALHALRRRRRLARVAADAVGRAELAWDDATAALDLIGSRPSPTQTPLEFAASPQGSRPDLGPVGALAHHVTLLRYADLDADESVEQARAARARSTEVVQRCHELAGRRAVLLAQVDPRPLVGAR